MALYQIILINSYYNNQGVKMGGGRSPFTHHPGISHEGYSRYSSYQALYTTYLKEVLKMNTINISNIGLLIDKKLATNLACSRPMIILSLEDYPDVAQYDHHFNLKNKWHLFLHIYISTCNNHMDK